MSREKNSISQLLDSQLFWGSLLFLILATAVNFLSSELIQYYFPNRQPIIDTLFLITPQIMWTQYLTDIAVLLSPMILLVYIIKNDFKHFPYYLLGFAITYFLRGILIMLNPIGGAFGNMNTYGITSIMQHGMFPSGHTILVFVSYFLSDKIVNDRARAVLRICCIVEVVSLILSRGHYGIDIVGGVLLAYFVVNELRGRKSILTI